MEWRGMNRGGSLGRPTGQGPWMVQTSDLGGSSSSSARGSARGCGRAGHRAGFYTAPRLLYWLSHCPDTSQLVSRLLCFISLGTHESCS